MAETISPVNSLICQINKLHLDKSYIINSIQHFDLLIASLHELDSMIEMYELKDAIAKQIKFLLINNSIFPGVINSNINFSMFDGHMLHTVIYGPPGVGKTRVCIILVKIWLALGMIKQPVESFKYDNENYLGVNPVDDKILNTLITVDKIKTDVIERLQVSISDMKTQLNLLDPNLQEIKVKLRKLKRLIPVNKPLPHNDLYNSINEKPRQQNRNDIDELLNEITKIETKLRLETSKYTPDEKIKIGLFHIIEYPKQNLPNPIINPIQNFPNPNVPIQNVPVQNVPVQNVPIQSPKTPDINSLVKIVGREDLVGGFLGQTALKTEKVLKESLGKVLFIDEAYSLANDDKDSYGREALTVLNRFMSEHPDELIVIFAGYREMMEQTIFKLQPGLKSRCTWIFEIEGYTEKGLAKIFEQQLKETGWKLSSDIVLEKFFKEYIDDFPAYGRDTNRLVFYCKMCYTETIFDANSSHDKNITESILINALKYLRKNRIKDSIEQGPIHPHMYL